MIKELIDAAEICILLVFDGFDYFFLRSSLQIRIKLQLMLIINDGSILKKAS